MKVSMQYLIAIWRHRAELEGTWRYRQGFDWRHPINCLRGSFVVNGDHSFQHFAPLYLLHAAIRCSAAKPVPESDLSQS